MGACVHSATRPGSPGRVGSLCEELLASLAFLLLRFEVVQRNFLPLILGRVGSTAPCGLANRTSSIPAARLLHNAVKLALVLEATLTRRLNDHLQGGSFLFLP